MSITREFLKRLEIPEAAVEKIIIEHGKAIQREQAKYAEGKERFKAGGQPVFTGVKPEAVSFSKERSAAEIEINSYDVKEAVLQRLRTKFPDIGIYIDEVREPVYPNFFIRLERSEVKRIGRNLYRFGFYVSVQYREAADPASVTQLSTRLDNVGNELNSLLQQIDLYGSVHSCSELRTGIIDNAMQAFFTVKLTGSLPVETGSNMEIIQHDETIKTTQGGNI